MDLRFGFLYIVTTKPNLEDMRIYQILVVDNQANQRNSYRNILSDSIFEPIFTSGKKNIAAILNEETIDAVIIDYDCPEIDACLIAEQSRNLRPNLPLILVSDNAGLLKNDSYLLSVSDDILQKPIESSNLIPRLRWHLKVNSKTNSINRIFFEQYLDNKADIDIPLW